MRGRLWLTVAAVAAVPALAACTAAGAGPEPGTGERTVNIRIHHSRFSPDTLTVPAGTTVRFVVSNADPIDHELIVGDEATQLRHEKGTEAHHGDRPGEVTVPAGSTAETTVTFPAPGRVLLGCHLPGHWDYGMKGYVEVRA